jgi:hypothetical protein
VSGCPAALLIRALAHLELAARSTVLHDSALRAGWPLDAGEAFGMESQRGARDRSPGLSDEELLVLAMLRSCHTSMHPSRPTL